MNGKPVDPQRIRQLVAALDDENHNDAEEAQFELTEDFGAEALEPLIAAAPRFSDFGRLCAIEVFEAIGDNRAAPVLIPWLTSANDVVSRLVRRRARSMRSNGRSPPAP